MCNPSNPAQDYSQYQNNGIPFNNVTVSPTLGAIFGTDQYIRLPVYPPNNQNSSWISPLFTLAFRYTHMPQFDHVGDDWSLNFISNDYGYNLLEWSSIDSTVGIFSPYQHTPFVPNIRLPLTDTQTHTFILTGNGSTFTLYMDTVNQYGTVPAFDIVTHVPLTIGNDYAVNHVQPCRGAINNFVIYTSIIPLQVLFDAYNKSNASIPTSSPSAIPTNTSRPSSSSTPSSTPFQPIPPEHAPFVIEDYADWEPLALAGSDQQFCYIDSCSVLRCPVATASCGLPLQNTSFTALYGSYGDNCEFFGRKNTSLVYGWGYNGEGRITGINSSVPYRSMSIGGHCTFALQDDHTLAVAGYNAWGQCVNPGGTYHRISAQYVSTCGISKRTNMVVCWGESHGIISGQQKLITRGDKVYCTLDTNGTVQCIGWYSLPTVGVPRLRYVTVNSGPTACGLLANFSIYCWGKPLADGPPNGQYVYITTSGGIFCAVSFSTTVVCWNGVYPALLNAVQGITVRLPSSGTILNQLLPNISSVCRNSSSYYSSSDEDNNEPNGIINDHSSSSSLSPSVLLTIVATVVAGSGFIFLILHFIFLRPRNSSVNRDGAVAYAPLRDTLDDNAL